jgi:manganese-dependent ADP-ribose/CDP-alcohol diphosphatase
MQRLAVTTMGIKTGEYHMTSKLTNLSRREFLTATAGLAVNACFLGGCCSRFSQSQDGKPFSFGVVTDVQYADADPGGSRIYRASPMKLKRCVDFFNTQDLAFVVHLGDLIDRDFDSFDTVLPLFDRCKHPVYQVLGNHDFSVDNAHKAGVPERLGLTQGYYNFSVGSWSFVVLDGNDLSLHAHVKGSDRYDVSNQMYEQLKANQQPNAQTWNGGMGKEQMVWLQSTLTQAEQSGQQVVVFCHWPIFPVASHNLWNDSEVVSVLESFDCVRAYMNGHNHAGHYDQKQGIHYVTFRGMVDGADRFSYGIVHCNADAIKITGYGDEVGRTLL